MELFTAPPRRYDPEYLDDRQLDDAVTLRTLNDIARSNRWFGGTRAAVHALAPVWREVGPRITLLDVGAGTGDVLGAVSEAALDQGIAVYPVGLERSLVLARKCAETRGAVPILAVCGDALTLPFPSRSIDVVMCSQLLHHFRDELCRTLLRELNRVARRAVVVCDLRRSRVAATGFWLASFPLGFHRITRHDGVVSVYRGYTADELRDTITDAVPVVPNVRRHAGYRLSAWWTPV